MKENAHIQIDQLLRPTEAARLKGMSLNQFKHHLSRPDAPTPILVGVFKHPHYDMRAVEAWQPNLEPAKGKRR